MIFGMTPFVFVHVLISLIGIASGFLVLFGLIARKRMDGLTAIFLLFTVLTSVTGFMLPAHKLMPGHIVGAISLVFLALAILVRYQFKMPGGWRRTYVISATASQYLNVFVLIAQLFQKVPALKAMAPTGSEPPFLIAQTVCLLFFMLLGVFATIKFRPMAAPATI
jgi:hypothetical protein